MPCYHPLLARYEGNKVKIVKRSIERGHWAPLPLDNYYYFNLPCGQCTGCRLQYSREWAVRCKHEAQMHEENCFLTLTFSPEQLEQRANPWSLDKRDFQLFMKRLRAKTGKKIRYFMCGEYGDENKRPHYHACLFGIDFSEDREPWDKSSGHQLYRSPLLEELWDKGYSRIGDLTWQSAAYVARYVFKKVKGLGDPFEHIDEETGEVIELENQFATMSRRPGLGENWYWTYGWSDAHANDFIEPEIEPRKCVKMRVPRYYDKLLQASDPEYYEELKEKRKEKSPDVIFEYDEKAEELWKSQQTKEYKLERLIRNL